MRLTPHFELREFACRHCGRTPQLDVARHLARHLERLRTLAGNRPLVIRSGYRCPTHNANVGGARYSRHLIGDAVDLDRGSCTVEQAAAAGFTGIGTRDGLPTHVDLRPRPARWVYR